MSSRDSFAFVFYATQWRPDLTWPLTCCLHSIDTHGGRAAEYPRYLVYSEEITPEIQQFCASRRLTIQRERRITYRLAWPNKVLMCRIPRHDVVCLMDLDLVCLCDPTPLFESVAADEKVRVRPDLLVPLRPWPSLPAPIADLLRKRLAPRVWRQQYERFGSRAAPEIHAESGGTMPPYFNNGVNFIPGKYLASLGAAWERVACTLLRDISWRRPYTALFTHYFLDQICFALAMHREAVPWRTLPPGYNLIPRDPLPRDEADLIARREVVLAHMVSPVRHWLSPEKSGEVGPTLRPLFQQVRAVVESARQDL